MDEMEKCQFMEEAAKKANELHTTLNQISRVMDDLPDKDDITQMSGKVGELHSTLTSISDLMDELPDNAEYFVNMNKEALELLNTLKCITAEKEKQE